ncbi:DNA alkylation repair protein [Sulfitobacter guttiformis]|uniref:3-methyladenine DNA glycosylase AlkC n=1 Tax=Sulfitobacter guttiformis TaxID=74349 RepID=A0A420DN80_9RHOB|nr:DNA alkylation repair protein [Sulfitobacter guttiformis]KIN72972.1 hypothetical protein Z949_2154 [Sulfitobacter guttiformis KCTC 32187]RKE95660.1 3-methyladenine DNA glycosylase AlkC [Sulfitobacter guttiformis]
MAEKFSLKDHLFNAQTVGQLAAEFAAGVSGFDAAAFMAQAMAGLPERELMARMEWLADCIAVQLADDFPTMAVQLEASMPPRLDPDRQDGDFGRFIHAVPGILAARHGLEHHRARAMALIHEATQRFSMEFYIRHFLNRWPEETLADLTRWAHDENYHVRRLVSEGTRPRLPWAVNVGLTTAQRLPLLDELHSDRTRYVTRSVANHLNDLSKIDPDAVLARLESWRDSSQQDAKELDWIRRHALRTLVKKGHSGAMTVLGYEPDAPVRATLTLAQTSVAMGNALVFDVVLNSDTDLPVLVDYCITFARASGKVAQKVFKLKAVMIVAGVPLTLPKSHKFNGTMSTFALHVGAHVITVQVNGRNAAQADFTLVA